MSDLAQPTVAADEAATSAAAVATDTPAGSQPPAAAEPGSAVEDENPNKKAKAAAGGIAFEAQSPEKLRKQIIQQIEYYFSDRNLPRDKFLKESRDAEGWLDLSVLMTFNKLKALTLDTDVVVEALRSVDNDPLVEVSDDGKKVRRSPTKPLAEQATLDARSVHIKRFPTETTLEEVQQWLRDAGYTPESVHMRKFVDSHKPKGSAFVQLDTVAAAEKLVASGLKYQDKDMVIEMKPAYHERKRAERKAKRSSDDKKKGGADAGKEEDAEPAMEKGCVIAVENIGADCSREDLKELFGEFGEVAWIDYQRGEDKGTVRFKEAANAAKAIESLTASKKELKGAVPSYRLLEGDEEKEHWVNVEASRKRKLSGGKRGRGSGRGRGRRGGGRSSKRAKRSDDGDD